MDELVKTIQNGVRKIKNFWWSSCFSSLHPSHCFHNFFASNLFYKSFYCISFHHLAPFVFFIHELFHMFLPNFCIVSSIKRKRPSHPRKHLSPFKIFPIHFHSLKEVGNIARILTQVIQLLAGFLSITLVLGLTIF